MKNINRTILTILFVQFIALPTAFAKPPYCENQPYMSDEACAGISDYLRDIRVSDDDEAQYVTCAPTGSLEKIWCIINQAFDGGYNTVRLTEFNWDGTNHHDIYKRSK